MFKRLKPHTQTGGSGLGVICFVYRYSRCPSLEERVHNRRFPEIPEHHPVIRALSSLVHALSLSLFTPSAEMAALKRMKRHEPIQCGISSLTSWKALRTSQGRLTPSTQPMGLIYSDLAVGLPSTEHETCLSPTPDTDTVDHYVAVSNTHNRL